MARTSTDKAKGIHYFFEDNGEQSVLKLQILFRFVSLFHFVSIPFLNL